MNADFHQSSDIGGAEEVEFSPNECFAVEVFCGSAGLTAGFGKHTQSTVAACVDVETDLPLGSFWCPLRNVTQGKGNTPFTTSSRPKANEVVAASRWFASSSAFSDFS